VPVVGLSPSSYRITAGFEINKLPPTWRAGMTPSRHQRRIVSVDLPSSCPVSAGVITSGNSAGDRRRTGTPSWSVTLYLLTSSAESVDVRTSVSCPPHDDTWRQRGQGAAVGDVDGVAVDGVGSDDEALSADRVLCNAGETCQRQGVGRAGG